MPSIDIGVTSEGQPVGRRRLQGRQRDLPAGSGAVLDHHRLRDHVAQFVGDAARGHVDGAAGREAGEDLRAVRQALGADDPVSVTPAAAAVARTGGVAVSWHVSRGLFGGRKEGPSNLPGFIRPCGSSARLIGVHQAQFDRRLVARRLVAPQHAQAVLGRDRAAVRRAPRRAPGGSSAFERDESRRVLRSSPLGGRRHVVVQVAIAQVAEHHHAHARERRSAMAASVVAMNSAMREIGSEMSCLIVLPSAPCDSEMSSRNAHRASNCDTLADKAASLAMPSFSAASSRPSMASLACASSRGVAHLEQHVPGRALGQRQPGCGHMLFDQPDAGIAH